MGYIPKDAKWYLAELLVKITVEGDLRNVLHTDMVLVRADFPEEAYRRAILLGKAHHAKWKNLAGKQVQLRFCGLRDLNVIHDELEHGAEIIFQQEIGLSDEQIRKLITPKKNLSVFRPIEPSRGPDYSAGDIMRKVFAQLKKQANVKQKKQALTNAAGSRSRHSPSRRRKSR